MIDYLQFIVYIGSSVTYNSLFGSYLSVQLPILNYGRFAHAQVRLK